MLTLPQPPANYSGLHETRRDAELKRADLENHKKTADLEVGERRRIILTAPNGLRFAVSVDNAGTLVVTGL